MIITIYCKTAITFSCDKKIKKYINIENYLVLFYTVQKFFYRILFQEQTRKSCLAYFVNI